VNAAATITGTIDRANFAASFTGRFAVGSRVGVYLRCSTGDWPAATYHAALAIGHTMATAQLARTATALTGTLDLSAAAIRDAWPGGQTGQRHGVVFVQDRTPRVWCAQSVRVYYIEDQAYV